MTRDCCIGLLSAISSCILILATLKPGPFGTEVGLISASIASGYGFSSPFSCIFGHVQTGPTAWVGPIYPYILALVFRIAGTFTMRSLIAIEIINSTFALAASILLYRAARRAFGESIGFSSGLLFAILPAVLYPLHIVSDALFQVPTYVWYTQLTTLIIVLLVLLTLRAHAFSTRTWIVYGIIWGIAALDNPGTLALMPAFVAWLLASRCRARELALAAVVVSATITPWLIRNYAVFQRPVFIRDNFGVELAAGNSDAATGVWHPEWHPTVNPAALQIYRGMGEPAFASWSQHNAVRFIRSHKGQFLKLCVLRFLYFWGGTPFGSARFPALAWIKHLPLASFSALSFLGIWVLIRDRNRQGWLFACTLALYPLIYYITYPGVRYLYPIQPEMIVLSVVAVRGIGSRRRTDVQRALSSATTSF